MLAPKWEVLVVKTVTPLRMDRLAEVGEVWCRVPKGHGNWVGGILRGR